MRPPHLPRVIALATTAVFATTAFALLTRAVARRRTERADATVLDSTFAAEDPRVRDTAEAISPAGKWYAYVPAAAITGAAVLLRGRSGVARRSAGGGAVLLSAITSALINPAFDWWLPQPQRLPPGRRSAPKPVFPSGHTFGLGSVAAAAAYVLMREDVAAGRFVVPAALLVPAVSAYAKMAEEKHWPSDVAGGALVAIAIASFWLTAYELTSD